MAVEFTWDPDNKADKYTLSNGDLTALSTAAGFKCVISKGPRSTGKFYFELNIDVFIDDISAAICTENQDHELYLQNSYDAWVFMNYGWLYHGVFIKKGSDGFAGGDIVGIAVDLDTGMVWFSVNNVWQYNGDPPAGANPCFDDPDIASQPIFATTAGYSADNQVTLFSLLSNLTYSPPDGFLAWGEFAVYLLSGTVNLLGNPVERTVRSYIRSTGELYDSVVSNPDGSFVLNAPDDTTEMFVIVLPGPSDDDYNALVYDKVKGIKS